jgi:hypothetical protein
MSDFEPLLVPIFPARHVNAAIKHFQNAATGFGSGDWEGGIAKAGKFIEAALKAMATHCSVPFGTGRQFKADGLITALGNLPQGSHNDSLRLLIPRACRIAYDISSNRGARHDPDEVDPNIMDANLVFPTRCWILAELIRFAQKDAVDPTRAQELVESLTEKKYPVVENVEGRIYLHARKKSAVDVGLVVLAGHYPGRVSKGELTQAIKRNGFKLSNAHVAVGRVAQLSDENKQGLRLLAPGLERAAAIIAAALRNKAAKR